MGGSTGAGGGSSKSESKANRLIEAKREVGRGGGSWRSWFCVLGLGLRVGREKMEGEIDMETSGRDHETDKETESRTRWLLPSDVGSW